MPKHIIKSSIIGHGDTDKKNSWYWSVLIKNYGSLKRAEREVKKSIYKANPLIHRIDY